MNEIKFGIKLATYYRDNKTTFSKISRAINSVNNQTYKNWTIFLVGDGYSNLEEFEDIKRLIPKDKLVYINLPKRYEKDVLGLSGEALWCSGGFHAANKSIELMKENNVDIYCNLDDDDFYSNNHLELLNKYYNMYKNVKFIYTRANYTNRENIKFLLPLENLSENQISPNNLTPRPGHVVHSSSSWNIKNIPLIYRNVIEQNRIYASDADMWERINKYCSDNKYDTLYIPYVTVHKDSEGDILKT